MSAFGGKADIAHIP